MEHDHLALDGVSVDRASVLPLILPGHVADLQVPLAHVRPHDAEAMVVHDAPVFQRQWEEIVVHPRYLQPTTTVRFAFGKHNLFLDFWHSEISHWNSPQRPEGWSRVQKTENLSRNVALVEVATFFNFKECDYLQKKHRRQPVMCCFVLQQLLCFIVGDHQAVVLEKIQKWKAIFITESRLKFEHHWGTRARRNTSPLSILWITESDSQADTKLVLVFIIDMRHRNELETQMRRVSALHLQHFLLTVCSTGCSSGFLVSIWFY